MTVVVHTRQLTKNYGRRPALHRLDLDLYAGEVYGLLGPNGAGKTTAIRLLMDLIRPTRGRIVLFGEDLATGSVQARQRIGYVPGDLVLYDRLTGEEHLRLFAGLRDHPNLTDARVLAKRLDLDLARRVGELSKGNRQKLGITQAFLHRPELVVLDEPTSGLDPVAQREFHAHLREFTAGGGTVLFSSHVLSEVEQVADRVGILLSGSLVVDAKVAALKAKALRALTFDFAEPVPADAFENVADVRDVRADGASVHCRVVGPVGELVRVASRFPLVNVTSHEPDLQEIFLDYVEGEDRDR
ncbi:ABC transporter ATP-binding protein [Actinosynnema sp. NPDC023794]